MGDSAAGHFAEIGRHFPEIDYAIIGIGAYNPSYIMQSSHLNPDEPIAELISRIRELFGDNEQLCELAIGEVIPPKNKPI